MDAEDRLRTATGFQWDPGNAEKNWRTHRVARGECEQLFFNQPLLVAADVHHSQAEDRYFVLGRTDAGRELFLVFTFRDGLIRVISARDMSRNEREEYRRHG